MVDRIGVIGRIPLSDDKKVIAKIRNIIIRFSGEGKRRKFIKVIIPLDQSGIIPEKRRRV